MQSGPWRSAVRLTIALVLTGTALAGAIGLSPKPAGAAISAAPVLASPSNGSTLSNFSPTLSWTLPPGATQVQLQVNPFQGDGPGVNVIVDATTSFMVPPPPDWYGLLPDLSYTWRVRATDATTAVGESDDSWGPWSPEFSFRTAQVDINTVSPFDPVGGVEVVGQNPVLRWSSATASLFYWEVQASKDPQFGSDSFLYWQLLHGDVVFPANAYTIPSSFLLESGTTYYWRLRPRVQGDGTPLPWTPAASFKTPAAGKVFLQLDAPADESEVSTSTVMVSGKTKPGAFVSVENQFVTADASGNFSVTVTLVEGLNTLDIIASDGDTGNTVAMTLTITYVP